MEPNINLIEPLLIRVEENCKASFELIKLKSVDKTADITSTFISRLILAIIIFLFVITLNIAISLWLGELLGKNYYGFLLVASIYFLIASILFFVHPKIKASLNDSIISQILN